MRVTLSSKYDQIQNSQGNLQSKLNELNTKIASGRKIQNSYENSHVYNKDLQLGYQETVLSQGIDIAQNSYNMTISTDKALNELSKAMVQFRTKLVQVGNQPQSHSSRLAIASELEALKNYMIDIANTAIGGSYLFSGTKLNTRPISQSGRYMGNDQKLEALLGSNNKIPFNIPGSDLFFGNNPDSTSSATSNIRKYNLSKLHPSVMDKLNKDEPPQEVFIKPTDTLRDLIGDDDDDPSNDQSVFFYLRGIRHDGTHFKAKFELEQGYIDETKEHSVKVSDLLDKIGKEFGNNEATKVVSVELNSWGEIEVKSLAPGNSNLKFHLLASNADVDDVSRLPEIGARVISFQKSPYRSNQQIASIHSVNDIFKKEQITLATSFISKTTKTLAGANTMLDDIFSSESVSIQLNGNFPKQDQEEANTPPILTFSTKESKLYDVLKAIESSYQKYNRKVEAQLADGKIIIIDLDAKKAGKPTDLSIKLSTHNAQGEAVDAIPTDYKSAYDDVYFEKSGSKLTANASQILRNKKQYATDQTRLIDVAGDLSNQIYKIDVKDHNGKEVSAKIFFDPRGIYLELPRQDLSQDQSPTIKIPVVDLNEKGDLNLAKPEKMTYRQLMDTLAIVLNYSNQEDKTYDELSKNPYAYSPEQKQLYEQLLVQSQGKVEVSLNQNGQITITDRSRSLSQMEFSFSNLKSDDFSAQTMRDTQAGLILHANDSLSINTLKLNFFESLNKAISAVQEGVYRPDEYPNSFNKNMRNIGIQNSLQVIEDLEKHLGEMVALNGSYSKRFENSISKNEILKTQVQSLRGENIGADVAEAYSKFQSIKANYDAALSSASKINKMSILDYI